MSDFGPFSVQAAQIAGLGGANFGQFINRLLDTEIAKQGMVGVTLETTYKENVGDGGVDAGLRNASATEWVPSGDSAWQFKAGNLQPAECKLEIAGATQAQEVIGSGGKYRLVLGVSIPSPQIAARKRAIEEELVRLRFSITQDTVEVLTADSLARWVESYPSLAISPLLRGIGQSGQTFDQWSRSIHHTTTWSSSNERDRQIQDLRNFIVEGQQVDVHLNGVSGLGKTRLVMEAMRGQQYEALVLYAPSADQFSIGVLNQLQVQDRIGIIVIDECDSKQHNTYAGVLQVSTNIRLITLGESSDVSSRSPMVVLKPLDDEAMTELLRKNQPNLWQEVIPLVVVVAAGNIDYALKIAKAVLADGTMTAGSLVTADDMRRFITDKLPHGALFLACCALALFSRFGYEREVAGELSAIAAGLRISEDDLKTAALYLADAGLLSKQGRYRSVGPHPMAVYLATRGWSEFGEQILVDLIPTLDDDFVERLFRRAADLGETDATRLVLARMLTDSGPLASLSILAEGNNSKILIHLAVLAPRIISARLAELIESATDEDIEEIQSTRRNLVWTLEKLAWHSETFEVAADLLLRLATVETERYNNNASGTWVTLFGTMLPGTAASPDTRMQYLWSKVVVEDDRVRFLVARAAGHALNVHESIMVSGEVQGGVVVEPRGTPVTLGDVWRYRNSAIDVLRNLVDDSSLEIAVFAIDALSDSIHSSLEAEAVSTHLAEVLASLMNVQLRVVRIQIKSLESLFDRVDNAQGRAAALAVFKTVLPLESSVDRLWTLAHGNAWDYSDGGLGLELLQAAIAISDNQPNEALFDLLSEKVPVALDIGRAIALLAYNPDSTIIRMTEQLDGPNPDALIGYLWARTETGEEGIFDTFLDLSSLDPSVRLRLTASGPRTERAKQRIDELLPSVSVSEAARVIFRWSRDLDDDRVTRYLESWLPKISSQDDYNAIVDFVALHIHREEPLASQLALNIQELIALRRIYSDLGQQEWDWTQLAKRQLSIDPLGLSTLLSDLIESDSLQAHQESEEGTLFKDSIILGGELAWIQLMGRIQGGSWRLNFAARAWLGSAVGISTAMEWVGGSVEKARILASVASIGEISVSEVGQYLLNNFGDDQQVEYSLVGEFVSGFWSGPRSARIGGQIEQLQSWIDRPGESSAVKRWAAHLISSLEIERIAVLEREQEGGW